MSTKNKEPPATQTTAQKKGEVGTVTSTGEVIVTPTGSNTNTVPALKTTEDYLEYNAAVRVIRDLQVEDPMQYQKEHGYYPMPGDTEIAKRGLSSDQQVAVMAGEATLEEVDKVKHIYRAEPIKKAA